jgi:GNAT superfamily N-acetyltransferase
MSAATLATRATLPSFVTEVSRIPGVITLKTRDSTAGFVRYQADGGVEYIFVRGLYRRQGLATLLLNEVRLETGREPVALPPISPLGSKLFKVAATTT